MHFVQDVWLFPWKNFMCISFTSHADICVNNSAQNNDVKRVIAGFVIDCRKYAGIFIRRQCQYLQKRFSRLYYSTNSFILIKNTNSYMNLMWMIIILRVKIKLSTGRRVFLCRGGLTFREQKNVFRRYKLTKTNK